MPGKKCTMILTLIQIKIQNVYFSAEIIPQKLLKKKLHEMLKLFYIFQNLHEVCLSAVEYLFWQFD